MLLHERRNEASDTTRQAPPAGGPSNLEQMRQRGESLLQAADQAIAQALSGDALAFLNATQQEGGQ
jgi:hypothetical protein